MNSQWKPYLLVGAVIFGVTVAVVAPHVTVGRAAFASAVPEPQDPDAGQPFQKGITVSLAGGGHLGAGSFTVPANKRLVIETITIEGSTPAGDMLAMISVTSGGAGLLLHRLVLTPQGTFFGKRVFVGTHLVRLYANAGSRVNSQVLRSDTTGSAEVLFRISGYLLNP
jgi:hypothetical protein